MKATTKVRLLRDQLEEASLQKADAERRLVEAERCAHGIGSVGPGAICARRSPPRALWNDEADRPGLPVPLRGKRRHPTHRLLEEAGHGHARGGAASSSQQPGAPPRAPCSRHTRRRSHGRPPPTETPRTHRLQRGRGERRRPSGCCGSPSSAASAQPSPSSERSTEPWSAKCSSHCSSRRSGCSSRTSDDRPSPVRPHAFGRFRGFGV